MRTRKLLIVAIFLPFLLNSQSQNTPSPLIEVKAYKQRLSDVMQTIAEKAQKKLLLNTDQNPLISFGSKDASLDDTLKKLSNLYGFDFDVEKDQIIVSDKTGGRGIASLEDEDEADEAKKALTPSEERASGLRFRTVSVLYGDPAAVLKQVTSVSGDSIKYATADTKNKQITFYGDEQATRLVNSIVDDLDVAPPQILLAAKVVETTKSFSRDLGVLLQRQPGLGHGNLNINNPAASNPFELDYTMGIIDATGVTASLQAGETNGDAKIISNPQVVTGDNIAASLNSTLTYNIRVNDFATPPTGTTTAGTTSTTGSSTTGAAAGSTSTSGTVVAGGLQQVVAGLQMTVTPKILRNGKIRLTISIDDSSPDTGSSVDGIPGINSTNMKTEMIVRPGQTAVIAGLYKNTKSTTETGVPFLMNIPIFGHLFKSTSDAKTRDELLAFITPSIIESVTDKEISFAEAHADAGEKEVKKK